MNLNLIKNIGPKTEKILNKINIFSVEDLVTYYPYRYNVIKFININDANENDICYVLATVLSVVKISFIKKNFNRLDFIAANNNISFKVTIFNRAFLKNNLYVNRKIVLIGKYNKIKNIFIANDIKFNVEDGTIEPIYHLTEGLKNSNLRKLINESLKLKYKVYDYVPDIFNDKYNFINKDKAIELIHNPNSISDIKSSKLKLIYEELFLYMFKINYLKLLNKKSNGIKKIFDENILNEFLNSLSFKLTLDQELVIKEILNDMKSSNRMNRLVLGDVGSGKTIVAIVAIFTNYLSSYQATFMAPTEILAKQHYETIKNYFEPYNIKIALLTGSTTKKNKEKIYEELESGHIDLLIGTHSLLNEQVIFKNLGLVITDEQHRFGVNQRNLLQNKGNKKESDVLYLSATPIPRTYALTIYGDLDLSQIKTKPNIRKEVITKVVLEKNIKEVLLKIYEELKLGHQIFVVSPLIEQNDEINLNSVYELKEKLSNAFNNDLINIEILHGKLNAKEKDKLMLDFKNGIIKILISTTVIEVGIDIPKASMIVIFNAERFGLATLHQLRGRVGRSDIQSYCYLITNNDDNERLKVMEESNDGFYISEKDFEQRGQGDLFGVKQSGDMTFKIADLKRDYKILLQAKLDSENYVRNSLFKGNSLFEKEIEKINFLD